jgi:3-oxoacyl-[acyl-carrier protein] reductase
MRATVPGERGPAVVTGAGRGLGRAFALALSRAGHPVVVADLDAGNAERVAAEVRAAGGQALASGVDVADPPSVARMAADADRAFGTPTVLVNNAAVFATLAMGPFTEITDELWDRVLRVNVTGAFTCCREIVPRMAEAGYGKVINISSASVLTGRPNYLHYVTSKAALIGLTRALASEVGGSGVRVNAVTHGSTRTEVERATITEADRHAMAMATALRREQSPEDLVGTIVFLAGPDSDFITGQTINVDGGYAFH